MDMSNYVQMNCINGISKDDAEKVKDIPQIQDDIDTITDTTIPAIQDDISTINETTIPAIQDDITDLDERVSILENSSQNDWSIIDNFSNLSSLVQKTNNNYKMLYDIIIIARCNESSGLQSRFIIYLPKNYIISSSNNGDILSCYSESQTNMIENNTILKSSSYQHIIKCSTIFINEPYYIFDERETVYDIINNTGSTNFTSLTDTFRIYDPSNPQNTDSLYVAYRN